MGIAPDSDFVCAKTECLWMDSLKPVGKLKGCKACPGEAGRRNNISRTGGIFDFIEKESFLYFRRISSGIKTKHHKTSDF